MKHAFGKAGSEHFHDVTASKLYSGGKRTNDEFENMNSLILELGQIEK